MCPWHAHGMCVALTWHRSLHIPVLPETAVGRHGAWCRGPGGTAAIPKLQPRAEHCHELAAPLVPSKRFQPCGTLQVMAILADSLGCCSTVRAREKPGGLCRHMDFQTERGMGCAYPSLAAHFLAPQQQGAPLALGRKAASAEASHQPQISVASGQLSPLHPG